MSTNKKTAQVFHFDLYGKRQEKYEFLKDNSLDSINWTELENRDPSYFFVPKNWDVLGEYEKGFKIEELFTLNNTGLNTEFDEMVLQDNKFKAVKLLDDLRNLSPTKIIAQFELKPNMIGKIEKAIADIKINNPNIVRIKTKPFEEKYTIYTGKSNGIMGRPRHDIMKYFLQGKNLGLVSMRQYAYNVPNYCYSFISREIVTSRLFISNKGYCSIFPLYLYPEENSLDSERTPNLKMEIVNLIADQLGLTFTNEKDTSTSSVTDNTFAPIDILDYIYAVLHSPTYREMYKEFLKIDFPRVPYPKSVESFWELVQLGGEIRQIHLLESAKVDDFITSYSHNGNNIITRKISKNDWNLFDSEKGLGRIWINDNQCFDKVPLVAWEFYIGGYQPAQKWLKDRRGRELSFEDLLHYQKIIVALTETDRLMKVIEQIEIE